VYTMRRMWSHLAEQPEGIVGATEQLLHSFRLYDTNQKFLNSLSGSNGR